ncbi:MAG: DegT/DnrJ/EryC1/StrS family aminotransferase [Planctomycetes bacterium]|nr:DegT/DnrJ/EryC1/StrS family aminotransferase [Planctomycetota bacterium]
MTDDVPTKDYARQYGPLWPELGPALERVFRGDAPVLGRAVREFEDAWAAMHGSRHCVGVGNGTDALALTLRAWGVGPGDEVVTCAHTFVATVTAIAMAGARPVLVDAEPESMLLDLHRVAAAVTDRTRALIPVHLYGRVVDPVPLRSLAERHGLRVLEDAAQAHGALGADLRLAGTIGDAGAFSFHPSKNLGAFGDAGAVLTDDDELAERLRVLRNLGKLDKYTVRALSPNSKLDTLQAVVLNTKLPHLDRWNRRRAELAGRYAVGLEGVGDLQLPEPGGGVHAWHLYVVRTGRRDALREFLRQRGVGSGIHYPIPPHLQSYDPRLGKVDLGYRAGDFPIAERLAETIVSLPLGHELRDDEIDRVIDTVREFFG